MPTSTRSSIQERGQDFFNSLSSNKRDSTYGRPAYNMSGRRKETDERLALLEKKKSKPHFGFCGYWAEIQGKVETIGVLSESGGHFASDGDRCETDPDMHTQVET